MNKIYEDIYLVELPLTGNPLKSLNCYIIKTEDANLIIDTGFNRKECKTVLLNALEELEIDYAKTSLFLTHMHSDHTGLASYFDKKNVNILISEKDGKLLNDNVNVGDFWKGTVERALRQGLAEDSLSLDNHPGFKNRPDEMIRYTSVKPGDNLKIGQYRFEIVDLEGHTPGMIGLYEKENKILFCGDHILAKITPNITFWGFEYGDMLGRYLVSLDKIYNMDINHLFSSHRYMVEDHRKRINEIKKHHEARLDEIRNVLKRHKKSSVRTITKNIHWDISCKSWGDFPESQKWYAAGEAQAHLERLRTLGEVTSEIIEGVIYYSLLS